MAKTEPASLTGHGPGRWKWASSGATTKKRLGEIVLHSDTAQT